MYNPESAAASRCGRQNRSEGAEFEKLIERSCEIYRAKGLAYIEKTPEPFRVISAPNARGQFIGYYEKQAQPDFKGTLLHGQSVVFDAKATSTDRIPMSALSDEQVKSLETHNAMGALAAVLMSYGFKRFYFMPYSLFMSAKELNGHKYWTADECGEITRELHLCGWRLNFLERYFDDV